MTPEERRVFVQMSKNKMYDEDNDDIKKFNETQTKKLNSMLKNQDKKLPKVCQGMQYTGPVIATHNVAQRITNVVITNDAHNKATNPGFKRLEDGRIFNH